MLLLWIPYSATREGERNSIGADAVASSFINPIKSIVILISKLLLFIIRPIYHPTEATLDTILGILGDEVRHENGDAAGQPPDGDRWRRRKPFGQNGSSTGREEILDKLVAPKIWRWRIRNGLRHIKMAIRKHGGASGRVREAARPVQRDGGAV